MHKQTKACAISREVKERVWERDQGRCVVCGRSYGAFPNAHFIPRSAGGLGVEENIVTLCIPCHHAYDNSDRRNEIRETLRDYLKEQYFYWDEKNLYYHKYQ